MKVSDVHPYPRLYRSARGFNCAFYSLLTKFSSTKITLYKLCAVRISHTSSTSESVQYGEGTSSVQARMYSTSEPHPSYVRARMCSTNQAHHQYERVEPKVLVQKGTTQKYLPMNKSLLLLMCQFKMIGAYGRLRKSINYEMLKEIFNSYHLSH